MNNEGRRGGGGKTSVFVYVCVEIGLNLSTVKQITYKQKWIRKEVERWRKVQTNCNRQTVYTH